MQERSFFIIHQARSSSLAPLIAFDKPKYGTPVIQRTSAVDQVCHSIGESSRQRGELPIKYTKSNQKQGKRRQLLPYLQLGNKAVTQSTKIASRAQYLLPIFLFPPNRKGFPRRVDAALSAQRPGHAHSVVVMRIFDATSTVSRPRLLELDVSSVNLT